MAETTQVQTQGAVDGRNIFEVVTEKALAGAIPVSFSRNDMRSWQQANWLHDAALKGIEFSDGSRIMVGRPAAPKISTEQTQPADTEEEDRVSKALANAIGDQREQGT